MWHSHTCYKFGGASPTTGVWAQLHDAQILFGGMHHTNFFELNHETQGNCKGVFAEADDAGISPHVYLKELLGKGV